MMPSVATPVLSTHQETPGFEIREADTAYQLLPDLQVPSTGLRDSDTSIDSIIRFIVSSFANIPDLQDVAGGP